MTVRYTDEVATAKCGGFLKLLRRWRGSIYKLIWKDLLAFLVLYYIFAVLCVYALNSTQKESFKLFAEYCNKVTQAIPLELFLGFYVGVIITRWTAAVDALPTPHRDVLLLTTYIYGQDDIDLLIKRTVIRYCVLGYIMLLRVVCVPLKRRYPTLEDMKKDGIITDDELKVIDSIPCNYSKFPIPISWAAVLLMKAYSEGRIRNEAGLYFMLARLGDYRSYIAKSVISQIVNVPLSYTQTVTLAVYLYFAFSLLGVHSTLGVSGLEWVFPFKSLVEFLVYVGWLKVAEMLINPFGDDDDDFDICGFVDRFLMWPSLVLKDVHFHQPQLVRDHYWDTAQFELPYTAATIGQKLHNVFERGSVDVIGLSQDTIREGQPHDSANAAPVDSSSWHVVKVPSDEISVAGRSSRGSVSATITAIRDVLARRPSRDATNNMAWPPKTDSEEFSHEF